KDEDLMEMVGTLHQDVCRASDDLEREDTPYRRRASVRAVFASIEATVFKLKGYALQNRQKVDFSAADIALLKEESYSVDNGKAQAQPKFIVLDKNFQFAVNMFSRALKPPFVLDKGKDWEAFRRAIQVKNRITHPKSPAALEISDTEMEDMNTAY